MNANYQEMAEKHGEQEARKRMEEIRELGGYGDVPHQYVGGLDVFGALDPSNTAIDEKSKDRIAELSGIKRKEADKLFKSGDIITGEQVIDNRA